MPVGISRACEMTSRLKTSSFFAARSAGTSMPTVSLSEPANSGTGYLKEATPSESVFGLLYSRRHSGLQHRILATPLVRSPQLSNPSRSGHGKASGASLCPAVHACRVGEQLLTGFHVPQWGRCQRGRTS
jgi:hypothetical protein